MIKMNMGNVGNTKTGVVKDIIVKSATPNKLKDILIGGGIVLVGITYLTTTAFRNGVKGMEAAEFRALDEAGLLGVSETQS